jgi:hypothetical protein
MKINTYNRMPFVFDKYISNLKRLGGKRGHADTRTCGHADMRTCGHADMRTCRSGGKRGHADTKFTKVKKIYYENN